MSLVTNERLAYLFRRYFEKKYTVEERDELFKIIDAAGHDAQLRKLMDDSWGQLSSAYQLDEEQSGRIFSHILAFQPQKVKRVKRLKRRVMMWSLAAVVLALLMMNWNWDLGDGTKHQVSRLTRVDSTAKSGMHNGNSATLILGNGRTIVLDSNKNGVIAQQSGRPVIKQAAQISYQGVKLSSEKVVYNTIVTPRGKQYRVILPDGSRVWLNAASSLRFPTAFVADVRHVVLKGEAYFEITENKDKPFTVDAGGVAVKVLGTRFDIMSYTDEPEIRATLFSGSIKISAQSNDLVLKPGEVGTVNRKQPGVIGLGKADMETVIAWKKGLFRFNHTSIQAVLRDIRRWYNVEVAYEGNEDIYLNGMISRDVDLKKALHMLEVTSNIEYEIKRNKVSITSSDKN